MNPKIVYNHGLSPAMGLLPLKMESLRARALVMAIGFQESKFESRFQIGGPARGYWQFERQGGIHGVLVHPATGQFIRQVLGDLDFPPAADDVICHNFIAYNDVLAAAFARLLLWTSPKQLPSAFQEQEAWMYYLDCWRPGKPRPLDWPASFKQGWEVASNG